MIANLKLYPKMKDSGAPWLGEVPEHWVVRKLRNVLREVTKRNRPDLPLLSVVREKGVILRDMINRDENHNFIPDDLKNYKVVRGGQFVMNKMKAWQGSYGISRHNGIVSPAYFIFDINGAEGAYFHSAIRSKAYISFFTQASDGVRIGQWDLSQDRMKEIPFLIPPPPEQTAIVRFLDCMDRHIRRYICSRQKLIKLLEEQKQAIIHRAVTRGLDPSVPLKSSGVEWLGDVPEHWEAVTLRRVISRAIDGPHYSPEYLDNGIPFISARNIKADRWSLDDAKFISEADYFEFSKRVIPKVGDVLYTKGGTTGVARVVDLPYRFQVWVHVAVLKVQRSKIIPEFLAMSLNSPRCYEQAQLLTRGATNQDLGLNRMKNIFLALPPLADQENILNHIGEATGANRAIIDRALREISLLREYRTRLISDVVAGKLDARCIVLPAAGDADVPEGCSNLLDAEAVIEDQETQEDLPAEAD